MATGVLVVLVGRAAKAAEYLVADSKEYVATLSLGIETDTEDTTGTVLKSSDSIPSQEEVLSAVSSFVGDVMQTPPMYSALKVDGKKLCDLARQGVTVEREARKITVHSISAEPTDSECDYILRVSCSSGTYIRTLCADIGKKLGCGGTMKTLCRASASGFTLSDAHTLAELENMSEAERDECIFPVEYIFRDLEAVTLPDFFARLAHSGLEIYLKKINLTLPLGTRVRLLDKDGFFAVGEVREYADGLAIKPIRQFNT
jgi:tRNA pseudouridine55 synthase